MVVGLDKHHAAPMANISIDPQLQSGQMASSSNTNKRGTSQKFVKIMPKRYNRGRSPHFSSRRSGHKYANQRMDLPYQRVDKKASGKKKEQQQRGRKKKGVVQESSGTTLRGRRRRPRSASAPREGRSSSKIKRDADTKAKVAAIWTRVKEHDGILELEHGSISRIGIERKSVGEETFDVSPPSSHKGENEKREQLLSIDQRFQQHGKSQGLTSSGDGSDERATNGVYRMVAGEAKFHKESRIQEKFLKEWVSRKNEERDANANDNEQVENASGNSSTEECSNDPCGKFYSKVLSGDPQKESPYKNSSTCSSSKMKVKDATLLKSSITRWKDYNKIANKKGGSNNGHHHDDGDLHRQESDGKSSPKNQRRPRGDCGEQTLIPSSLSRRSQSLSLRRVAMVQEEDDGAKMRKRSKSMPPTRQKIQRRRTRVGSYHHVQWNPARAYQLAMTLFLPQGMPKEIALPKVDMANEKMDDGKRNKNKFPSSRVETTTACKSSSQDGDIIITSKSTNDGKVGKGVRYNGKKRNNAAAKNSGKGGEKTTKKKEMTNKRHHVTHKKRLSRSRRGRSLSPNRFKNQDVINGRSGRPPRSKSMPHRSPIRHMAHRSTTRPNTVALALPSAMLFTYRPKNVSWLFGSKEKVVVHHGPTQGGKGGGQVVVVTRRQSTKSIRMVTKKSTVSDDKSSSKHTTKISSSSSEEDKLLTSQPSSNRKSDDKSTKRHRHNSKKKMEKRVTARVKNKSPYIAANAKNGTSKDGDERLEKKKEMISGMTKHGAARRVVVGRSDRDHVSAEDKRTDIGNTVERNEGDDGEAALKKKKEGISNISNNPSFPRTEVSNKPSRAQHSHDEKTTRSPRLHKSSRRLVVEAGTKYNGTTGDTATPRQRSSSQRKRPLPPATLFTHRSSSYVTNGRMMMKGFTDKLVKLSFGGINYGNGVALHQDHDDKQKNNINGSSSSASDVEGRKSRSSSSCQQKSDKKLSPSKIVAASIISSKIIANDDNNHATTKDDTKNIIASSNLKNDSVSSKATDDNSKTSTCTTRTGKQQDSKRPVVPLSSVKSESKGLSKKSSGRHSKATKDATDKLSRSSRTNRTTSMSPIGKETNCSKIKSDIRHVVNNWKDDESSLEKKEVGSSDNSLYGEQVANNAKKKGTSDMMRDNLQRMRAIMKRPQRKRISSEFHVFPRSSTLSAHESVSVVRTTQRPWQIYAKRAFGSNIMAKELKVKLGGPSSSTKNGHKISSSCSNSSSETTNITCSSASSRSSSISKSSSVSSDDSNNERHDVQPQKEGVPSYQHHKSLPIKVETENKDTASKLLDKVDTPKTRVHTAKSI